MKNVAFVTGGSGGIGSAVCMALAEIGCPVAIGYNSDKKSACDVSKKINENGGVSITIKCDVSDGESIENAISEIEEKLGNVEILVNNAGVSSIGLFTDLSEKNIFELININLVGAMLCAKRVLPQMIRNKHGKIINITSVWGEVGASCEVVYSASKAGLIGFTKALAKEVAPSGINVNAVSAGMIDTKMNSELSQQDIDNIVEDIPMCRIGQPEDIAKAVVFLATEKSDYITGQIVRVDGGWI